MSHGSSWTSMWGSSLTTLHNMKHNFIHDFILAWPANEPDPEIPIGHDIGQVCALGHDAVVQYIPPAPSMWYEIWLTSLITCATLTMCTLQPGTLKQWGTSKHAGARRTTRGCRCGCVWSPVILHNKTEIKTWWIMCNHRWIIIPT